MKNRLSELLFGQNTALSGVIAMAVIGSVLLGCNCSKKFDIANTLSSGESVNRASSSSSPTTLGDEIPSKSVIEALVKRTVSLFADAVDSGDFSELYNGASKDFQNTYTIDEMKTAFKSYLDKKSMVLPIMRKVSPMSADFKNEPGTRSEKGLKILTAQGEFKTKPYKTRFDFEYVMRSGEWKLLKLVINIP